MASEAQNRANRANAERSTGPRTAAGKDVSRLNALKHGILAGDVVLPNEDAGEFDALKGRIYEELEPFGELEELQVDLIAANARRLRRVMRVEKGIFIQEVYGQMAEEARLEAFRHVSFPHSIRAQLAESVAADDGKAEVDDPEALDRAREAKAVQAGGDGTLGRAFITQNDTFSRLARYEAHIQRSLFRALEELRHLQASRRDTGRTASQNTPARRELETKSDESDP